MDDIFYETDTRGLYYKLLGVCKVWKFDNLQRKSIFIIVSHFHLLGKTL